MMLSFAIQATFIALGVILSILTVHKLDAVSLPQPSPPYPRAPKPVKLVETPGAVSSGLANPRATRSFVIPARVPVGVAVIDDGPEMMLAQAPSWTGAGDSESISGGLNVPSWGHPPVIAAAPPIEKKREPSQVAKPLRIGGDVMEARLIKRVMPAYPPLARQARIAGTVRLEGVIARDGRVVNLQVHSGHPLLIAAAVDAVRQWIYRPTLLNGEPVEVIAPIQVHFTLSQ
ncbi:MAG TPA: energy transducer TonB [Bryobacteraceae bacterium]|nr:energy transducer TonB [Bryobacteraceae bacterium]